MTRNDVGTEETHCKYEMPSYEKYGVLEVECIIDVIVVDDNGGAEDNPDGDDGGGGELLARLGSRDGGR